MSKKSEIHLTEKEKIVVEMLGHKDFTVEYLEYWLNRNDSPFSNAYAAMKIEEAKGFYEAVKLVGGL